MNINYIVTTICGKIKNAKYRRNTLKRRIQMIKRNGIIKNVVKITKHMDNIYVRGFDISLCDCGDILIIRNSRYLLLKPETYKWNIKRCNLSIRDIKDLSKLLHHIDYRIKNQLQKS